MGGVWERKIGSVKKVLNASIKLLNNRDLSREEFHTLLQEASSIVNRTPLYEVSADPLDPFPITPDMLLTLKDNPHSSPPEDFTEKDLFSYGKRRWRRVQYLSDQFWSRWRRHYVNTLQERRKWVRPKPNLAVGDIVLMRSPAPRNKWPLARVTSVKCSPDGFVRSVDVYTPTSKRIFTRSVHDLVLVIPCE